MGSGGDHRLSNRDRDSIQRLLAQTTNTLQSFDLLASHSNESREFPEWAAKAST